MGNAPLQGPYDLRTFGASVNVANRHRTLFPVPLRHRQNSGNNILPLIHTMDQFHLQQEVAIQEEIDEVPEDMEEMAQPDPMDQGDGHRMWFLKVINPPKNYLQRYWEEWQESLEYVCGRVDGQYYVRLRAFIIFRYPQEYDEMMNMFPHTAFTFRRCFQMTDDAINDTRVTGGITERKNTWKEFMQ